MTNFDKIRKYYNNFNEKDRLKNDFSGRLEYDMTMKILEEYLPKEANILDLGGGAGVYTFKLAEKGYSVSLADLSPKLIAEAKEIKANGDYKNVKSIDVVNALDLGIYENNSFDVVLLFGPLYHLLEEEERNQCISEVNRVLKSGGMVLASFIPYLSGSIAIIDRYFRHSEQVDAENLRYVFDSGKFNNCDQNGFQEGFYPTISQIEELFNNNGFDKKIIKSIRGIGYEKEENLYNVKNKEIFDEMIKLILETSTYPDIINMCGHAMYIGIKK